ncbi:unnamed protein product, partial [Heterosigma akashiwo]
MEAFDFSTIVSWPKTPNFDEEDFRTLPSITGSSVDQDRQVSFDIPDGAGIGPKGSMLATARTGNTSAV